MYQLNIEHYIYWYY